MIQIAAETKVTINAPLSHTFETIVPISLPLIFKGFGPLPAVTGTKNQTGAWDSAGQTRVVQLSDGSEAQEQLTGYEYPMNFTYTVSRFTGILRFIAEEAHGEWWFEPSSTPDKTDIRWRYAFISKSWYTAPIMFLITKTLWRCYMKEALTLSRVEVEQTV